MKDFHNSCRQCVPLCIAALVILVGGCRHTTPPPEDGLTDWRCDALTTTELEGWRRASGESTDDPQAACGDMAMVLSLAAEVDPGDPTVAAPTERAVEALLVKTLRKHLQATIVVPEDQVEKVFSEHPDAFSKPRRLRLRNLFLSYPPGASHAERASVRTEMQTLLDRLEAGEDFGELAAAESDSQTRFRKGLMGTVDPDALPPALQEIVLGLDPGEISPIIESPDGLSLIKCDAVIPARTPTPAEVREKLRGNLRRIEEGRRWEALVRELGGDPSRPDAAFKTAAAERARTLDLDREPTTAAAIRWIGLRYRAGEALRRRVESELEAPTKAEVRAFFEDHRERFAEPETFELSVIRLDSEAADDAVNLHRRAFELSHALSSGNLDFSEAARRFSDDPSASSGGALPPMTRRRLAGRGPEFMKSVTALKPGEISREFMASGSWWILRLDAHRPSRLLSFDEAREDALNALMRKRTTALQDEIEAEIRRGLEIPGTSKRRAPRRASRKQQKP